VVSPALGEAQRLEADDGKHAGHDVEDDAAEHRRAEAQQNRGEQACIGPAAFHRQQGPARRDRTGPGLEAEAQTSVELEHAFHGAGNIAASRWRLDHQQVAVASGRLRLRISDGAIGQWVEVGPADIHPGGNRHRQPEAIACDRELRRLVERFGQCGSKCIEPRAVGWRDRAIAHHQVDREHRLFGHANLIGAGEPVKLGADRKLCPRL
jgi:hypothetical protein